MDWKATHRRHEPAQALSGLFCFQEQQLWAVEMLQHQQVTFSHLSPPSEIWEAFPWYLLCASMTLGQFHPSTYLFTTSTFPLKYPCVKETMFLLPSPFQGLSFWAFSPARVLSICNVWGKCFSSLSASGSLGVPGHGVGFVRISLCPEMEPELPF